MTARSSELKDDSFSFKVGVAIRVSDVAGRRREVADCWQRWANIRRCGRLSQTCASRLIELSPLDQHPIRGNARR